MNTRPQMTSVELRMRIPAWRSASPMKQKTRPEAMLPRMAAPNLAISPNEAIQSRGIASQPVPIRQPSPDDLDLRMGRQERLREHVVERESRHERDHHRLVDRAAHS